MLAGAVYTWLCQKQLQVRRRDAEDAAFMFASPTTTLSASFRCAFRHASPFRSMPPGLAHLDQPRRTDTQDPPLSEDPCTCDNGTCMLLSEPCYLPSYLLHQLPDLAEIGRVPGKKFPVSQGTRTFLPAAHQPFVTRSEAAATGSRIKSSKISGAKFRLKSNIREPDKYACTILF